MPGPARISRRAQRALFLIGALGLVAACGKEDKQDKNGSRQPAVNAPTEAPSGGNGQLLCDDFLLPADLTALNLTKDKLASELVSDHNTVNCNYGRVSINIWRGDNLAGTVEEVKANGAKQGLTIEDGPKVGADTLWTSSTGMHMMHFVPANKKFTAAVTGSDKAIIVRVGTALLAKFDKM